MFSVHFKQFFSYLRGEIVSQDGNLTIKGTEATSASFEDGSLDVQKEAEQYGKEYGKILNQNSEEQFTHLESGAPHRNAGIGALQKDPRDTCSEDSFENISITDLDYSLTNLTNSLHNVRHSLSEVVNKETAMHDGLNTPIETETTFIEHESLSETVETASHNELNTPIETETTFIEHEPLFEIVESDIAAISPEVPLSPRHSATEIQAIVIANGSLSDDSCSDIDLPSKAPPSEYSPNRIDIYDSDSLDSTNETFKGEDQFAFEDFLAASTKQTKFTDEDKFSRDVVKEIPELTLKEDKNNALFNSMSAHTNLAFISETDTENDDQFDKNRPISESVHNKTSATGRWLKIKKATVDDTKTDSSAKVLWSNPAIAAQLLQSYKRAKERRQRKSISLFDVVRTVHGRRLGNRLKSFVDSNISTHFHFSTRKYYDIDDEDDGGQEIGRYKRPWWKKKPKTGRERIVQYKFFGMTFCLSPPVLCSAITYNTNTHHCINELQNETFNHEATCKPYKSKDRQFKTYDVHHKFHVYVCYALVRYYIIHVDRQINH